MDSESKKLLRDRILLIGIPILVIVLIVLGCWGIPRIKERKNWYKDCEKIEVTVYLEGTDQGEITTRLDNHSPTKIRFTGYKGNIEEAEPQFKIKVGKVTIAGKHIPQFIGEKGYVRYGDKHFTGHAENDWLPTFYYSFYVRKNDDYRTSSAELRVQIEVDEQWERKGIL